MVLSISVQLLNGYIQSQSTHRKKQKLDPPWFRGNHDQKAKKSSKHPQTTLSMIILVFSYHVDNVTTLKALIVLT